MRGGWWCCCKTVVDCFIAEDNFTETGTEPVAPAGWTEVYGDWLVDPVADVLYTESADGFLQYDTINPGNYAANYVEVDVTFDTRRDKAQVVFAEAYVIDRLVFELEWSPTCSNQLDVRREMPSFAYFGAATMRIYRNADVIAEAVRVPVYAATVRIKAGYTIGDKVAWMEVETLGWSAHPEWAKPITCIRAEPLSVGNAARYVGLGTGDTVEGTIIFDNFRWYRSYTPAIPNCPGPCDPELPISTCIIDPRFCVPTKNPLISSDIYLDWTIVSGTWRGEEYDVGGFAKASRIMTASSDALIESNTDQTGVSVFGYMFMEMYVNGREGDVFRIYLDYAATDNCHLAEFVLGDATGAGGIVNLYKNGVLLTTESYPLYSGVDVRLKVCTRPDDNSDYDIFFADVIGVSAWNTPWNGILTATTVNGNKRRALGTGAVSDEVIFSASTLFHTITLDDDRLCPCTWVPECSYCPAGEWFDTGLSISISGWQTPYGGACDCPTELDGTYNIPSHYRQSVYYGLSPCINGWMPNPGDPYPWWLSGGGLHHTWWWDTSCTYQAGVTMTIPAIGLTWMIVAGESNDWVLYVQITLFYKWLPAIIGSTPRTDANSAYLYKATFDKSVKCNSLVDEPLSFDWGGSVWEQVCEGGDALTVTVTSY